MDNTDTNIKAPTKEEMLSRVKLLSDEMDANDEENRAMQSEIDSLYVKIDAQDNTLNTDTSQRLGQCSCGHAWESHTFVETPDGPVPDCCPA